MKKLLFFVLALSMLLPISYAASRLNLEEQMLANFVQTGDPALDLYTFAKDNNLSLKKAKKILKKNIGTPQVSQELYFESITRTRNPEVDLENYAIANNITKEEAKEVLEELFGEPELP